MTNRRDKNPFSSFLALLRRHDVFLLQSVWFPLTKGFNQKDTFLFTSHLTKIMFVISRHWQKHLPVAMLLRLARPPLIGQEPLKFLGLVMPCGHINTSWYNLHISYRSTRFTHMSTWRFHFCSMSNCKLSVFSPPLAPLPSEPAKQSCFAWLHGTIVAKFLQRSLEGSKHHFKFLWISQHFMVLYPTLWKTFTAQIKHTRPLHEWGHADHPQPIFVAAVGSLRGDGRDARVPGGSLADELNVPSIDKAFPTNLRLTGLFWRFPIVFVTVLSPWSRELLCPGGPVLPNQLHGTLNHGSNPLIRQNQCRT